MIEWITLKYIERSRTYYFENDRKLRINNVVAVCVRQSGTHRLKTKEGKFWVIPATWLGIEIDCNEFTF